MPQYDEFDDQDQKGTFSRMLNIFNRDPVGARSPFFALAIVGALGVLLGLVLYISYPRAGVQPGDENVPVIRADAGPVKVAPDSQGGMDIPNRESTVFNTMRGQGPDSKVESLLPQTEQPVDRNKVFAGIKTDDAGVAGAKPADLTESASQMASAAPAAGQEPAETQPSEQNESGAPASTQSVQVGGAAGFAPQPSPSTGAATPAAVAEGSTAVTSQGAVATTPPKTAMHTDTQPPVATSAPVPESARTAPATEEPAVASPEPVKTEELATGQPKTVAPAAKAAAPAKGGKYVQLAAIKDKSAAAASWKNLQKQYPQLAGEKYRVQAATVKGSNFYRLQAGPLSADKAKSICKSVNAKKAGACLVVSG